MFREERSVLAPKAGCGIVQTGNSKRSIIHSSATLFRVIIVLIVLFQLLSTVWSADESASSVLAIQGSWQEFTHESKCLVQNGAFTQ